MVRRRHLVDGLRSRRRRELMEPVGAIKVKLCKCDILREKDVIFLCRFTEASRRFNVLSTLRGIDRPAFQEEDEESYGNEIDENEEVDGGSTKKTSTGVALPEPFRTSSASNH
ncbi:hypothetical protein C4D60_Mb03t12140 [Musa balbisiana]|uniref:Uncharacterized protein n=1 Tax=Musa balbisiana TaxID=52838 RepID=A0A4S8J9Q5_MUSBA|nr:hypothetical protein C4D60_Mb03t12140 [Musa balbisiana]